MLDRVDDLFEAEKNTDLEPWEKNQKEQLPTLWLLGKTGAGKSSLIQAITGLNEVAIGNGFAPCTTDSFAYEFPKQKPLVRFLDTRGLGEANYDPNEDISLCAKQGHMLLIVAKIDEPEQSSVVEALKKIKKQSKIKHLLVVHTGVQSLSAEHKARMLKHNQIQFEHAWGKRLARIEVDFDCDQKNYFHLDELITLLSANLPILTLMLRKDALYDQEELACKEIENEILWYAASASASDLLPLLGMISVPSIQAKMLHSLASHYAVAWNKRILSELISALGGSFVLQYSVKLGLRQLTKLLPVYGQSVGMLTAAAMSFATTYALGRAACYYFYHKNKGESIDHNMMQKHYEKALKAARKVNQ